MTHGNASLDVKKEMRVIVNQRKNLPERDNELEVDGDGVISASK